MPDGSTSYDSATTNRAGYILMHVCVSMEEMFESVYSVVLNYMLGDVMIPEDTISYIHMHFMPSTASEVSLSDRMIIL